jgi:hypothetical protein
MPISPEMIKAAAVKSMSQAGAKELAAAISVYASARDQHSKAFKKWAASIGIGTVVSLDERLFPNPFLPWEVIAVHPPGSERNNSGTGNQYDLQNLTGEVVSGYSHLYMKPFGDAEATRAILKDRVCDVKIAVENADEATLAALEDLLAKRTTG